MKKDPIITQKRNVKKSRSSPGTQVMTPHFDLNYLTNITEHSGLVTEIQVTTPIVAGRENGRFPSDRNFKVIIVDETLVLSLCFIDVLLSSTSGKHTSSANNDVSY